jgi:hypothetical protein
LPKDNHHIRVSAPVHAPDVDRVAIEHAINVQTYGDLGNIGRHLADAKERALPSAMGGCKNIGGGDRGGGRCIIDQGGSKLGAIAQHFGGISGGTADEISRHVRFPSVCAGSA